MCLRAFLAAPDAPPDQEAQLRAARPGRAEAGSGLPEAQLPARPGRRPRPAAPRLLPRTGRRAVLRGRPRPHPRRHRRGPAGGRGGRSRPAPEQPPRGPGGPRDLRRAGRRGCAPPRRRRSAAPASASRRRSSCASPRARCAEDARDAAPARTPQPARPRRPAASVTGRRGAWSSSAAASPAWPPRRCSPRAATAVDLLEKNDDLGGRVGSVERDGFRFDTGASWYLMPEVFEHFFSLLGTTAEAELDLTVLDPSYRVFFEGHAEPVDLRPDRAHNRALFERLEPGAGRPLRRLPPLRGGHLRHGPAPLPLHELRLTVGLPAPRRRTPHACARPAADAVAGAATSPARSPTTGCARCSATPPSSSAPPPAARRACTT